MRIQKARHDHVQVALHYLDQAFVWVDPAPLLASHETRLTESSCSVNRRRHACLHASAVFRRIDIERALNRGIDPDKAWRREGFAEEELHPDAVERSPRLAAQASRSWSQAGSLA